MGEIGSLEFYNPYDIKLDVGSVSSDDTTTCAVRVNKNAFSSWDDVAVACPSNVASIDCLTLDSTQLFQNWKEYISPDFLEPYSYTFELERKLKPVIENKYKLKHR